MFGALLGPVNSNLFTSTVRMPSAHAANGLTLAALCKLITAGQPLSAASFRATAQGQMRPARRLHLERVIVRRMSEKRP